MGTRPHETDARRFGHFVITLEFLAVAPNIHVEDALRDVPAGRMFGRHERLLDGIHAADTRAVAVRAPVRAPRSHALQPGDLAGFASVRRADEMPHARAAGRQEALVFKAGDDVGDAAVAVKIEARGIEGLEAGGEDDRTDMDRHRLFLVVEIDGAGGAEFLAGPAFAALQVDAVVAVDGVFEGHRLPVLDIGGFPFVDPHVEFVVDLPGAFFGAEAAGDTFVHIDVSRFFSDVYGKISGVSRDALHFRKR